MLLGTVAATLLAFLSLQNWTAMVAAFTACVTAAAQFDLAPQPTPRHFDGGEGGRLGMG